MLQIQHIYKEYKTGSLVQKALDDVSLNLRDNEFVAILGPSGSGKTTLLNIIGGLDRYDSGDLIINGISTKKYNRRNGRPIPTAASGTPILAPFSSVWAWIRGRGRGSCHVFSSSQHFFLISARSRTRPFFSSFYIREAIPWDLPHKGKEASIIPG